MPTKINIKKLMKYTDDAALEIDSVTNKYLTQIKRVTNFSKYPATRLPKNLDDQIDKTVKAAKRAKKTARIVFYKQPPQKYIDMILDKRFS